MARGTAGRASGKMEAQHPPLCERLDRNFVQARCAATSSSHCTEHGPASHQRSKRIEMSCADLHACRICTSLAAGSNTRPLLPTRPPILSIVASLILSAKSGPPLAHSKNAWLALAFQWHSFMCAAASLTAGWCFPQPRACVRCTRLPCCRRLASGPLRRW